MTFLSLSVRLAGRRLKRRSTYQTSCRAETILNPFVQTIRDYVDSVLDPSLIAKIERRANVPVAYARVAAGSSTKFATAKVPGLTASGGATAEPFIPTSSALGLNRDEYPAGVGITELMEAGPLPTPFDAVYFHDKETAHVEVTDDVAEWMCREVSAVSAAPLLTSITPTKRPVGGVGFTLTAVGEDLSSDLVLVWTNTATEQVVELTTEFIEG